MFSYIILKYFIDMSSYVVLIFTAMHRYRPYLGHLRKLALLVFAAMVLLLICTYNICYNGYDSRWFLLF